LLLTVLRGHEAFGRRRRFWPTAKTGRGAVRPAKQPAGGLRCGVTMRTADLMQFYILMNMRIGRTALFFLTCIAAADRANGGNVSLLRSLERKRGGFRHSESCRLKDVALFKKCPKIILGFSCFMLRKINRLIK